MHQPLKYQITQTNSLRYSFIPEKWRNLKHFYVNFYESFSRITLLKTPQLLNIQAYIVADIEKQPCFIICSLQFSSYKFHAHLDFKQ